jgi:hypothetical protein
MNKSAAVTDRALFAALKQLSHFERYNDIIARPAYRLLMKSWYDKGLLDVVLRHYRGLQKDWQDLSRVLSAISIADPDLDALILRGAIFIHQPSEGAQRVFIKSPDNPAADEFTYFCIYEMIVNAFKPMYETVLFLEKLYQKRKDHYLAFALSHAYLNHGINTARSPQIISDACAFQETDDILFPIFKTHLDKFSPTPYIEKNQPFIYHSLPGKNVFLYYRVKDETHYHKRRMRYLRYGLYAANVAAFYGETIVYYYSEEMSTGSITTAEKEVQAVTALYHNNPADPYYLINNAVIYEQMFKYASAEEQLEAYLKPPRSVNAKLL